uniref:Conotoxin Cal12.4 n=1 Tax=Californiconus californicus TaxID=1736779 RepID=O1C4_CONCL|nr:RecName: Full=Conotoxin Cal12.4; AltName: Full=O1_cal12b; Flags: Precursor [Californiconus californicus]
MKLTCMLVVLLLVLPFGDLIANTGGLCGMPPGVCYPNGCACGQDTPCCHPSGCNRYNYCGPLLE